MSTTNTRRKTTGALVTALALGATVAGTTTANATAAEHTAAERASAGRTTGWTAPRAFTSASANSTAYALETATDGTAFAAWITHSTAPGSDEVWVAKRAANSAAWSRPAKLAANSIGSVRLTTAADGSVTAYWPHAKKIGAKVTYYSATLSRGAARWTPAAPLAPVGKLNYFGDVDLESRPGGGLIAAWTLGADAGPTTNSALYVSQQSRTGGPWSKPEKIANGFAGEASVLAEKNGRVTVAWRHEDDGAPADKQGLHIASKASASAKWSAPQVVGGPRTRMTWYADLKPAANGAAVLTWGTPGDQNDPSSERYPFSYRPAGSTKFGAAEIVPAATAHDVTRPLIEKNGSLTYVWKDKAGAVSSATRAASGKWSAPKVLAASGGGQLWEPSIGTDGTVNVLWSEAKDWKPTGRLVSVTRSGGVWRKPVNAAAIGKSYPKGLTTTGRNGRVTALWNKNTDPNSTTTQVWSIFNR